MSLSRNVVLVEYIVLVLLSASMVFSLPYVNGGVENQVLGRGEVLDIEIDSSDLFFSDGMDVHISLSPNDYAEMIIPPEPFFIWLDSVFPYMRMKNFFVSISSGLAVAVPYYSSNDMGFQVFNVRRYPEDSIQPIVTELYSAAYDNALYLEKYGDDICVFILTFIPDEDEYYYIGLQVFNATESSSIEIVMEILLEDWYDVYLEIFCLIVQDDLLFLSIDSNIYVFDIGDVWDPVLVGGQIGEDLDDFWFDLFWSDGLLYGVKWLSGLVIYNITDSVEFPGWKDFIEVGSYNSDDDFYFHNLVIHKDYAYILTSMFEPYYESQIKIVDVGEPNLPTFVEESEILEFPNYPNKISIVETRSGDLIMYLNIGVEWDIYNVTDPSDMEFIRTLLEVEVWSDFFCDSEEEEICIVGSEYQFHTFNISDPTNPVLISPQQYELPQYGQKFGKFLYCVGKNGHFEVYDVSNSNNGVRLVSISTEGFMMVHPSTFGGFLYVVAENDFLVFLSLETPRKLLIVRHTLNEVTGYFDFELVDDSINVNDYIVSPFLFSHYQGSRYFVLFTNGTCVNSYELDLSPPNSELTWLSSVEGNFIKIEYFKVIGGEYLIILDELGWKDYKLFKFDFDSENNIIITDDGPLDMILIEDIGPIVDVYIDELNFEVLFAAQSDGIKVFDLNTFEHLRDDWFYDWDLLNIVPLYESYLYAFRENIDPTKGGIVHSDFVTNYDYSYPGMRMVFVDDNFIYLISEDEGVFIWDVFVFQVKGIEDSMNTLCSTINMKILARDLTGNVTEEFSVSRDEFCLNGGWCKDTSSCYCNDYVGDICESWMCNKIDSGEKEVCSGNGNCTSPDFCECNGPYYGEDCGKNHLLLSVMMPMLLLSGFTVFLFVILVCSCVCCLCCSCFLVLMVFLCCFVGIALKQSKIVKKAKKLDLDMLLKEQELEQDTSVAHIKIDKSLFEIDMDKVNILSIIGEGGSASMVFKALWQGKEVAFKCFKTKKLMDSQEDFAEFEREVQLLSSISHPNIIRFFGACLKPPRVGIVMEFCPRGEILEFVIKFRKEYNNEYPILQKIRLFLEVASALEYLHGKNIIHRDVKCENVLISDDFSSKLMDFGLSRVVEKNSSNQTKRIGTNFYMAPELVTSRNYNEKCDVFSLAILMFCLLIEKDNPYKCGDKECIENFNIEFRVANDPSFRPDVQVLKEKLKEYDEFLDLHWLQNLIVKCWDVDPVSRYSCKEIREFIENTKVEDCYKKPELVDNRNSRSSSLASMTSSSRSDSLRMRVNSMRDKKKGQQKQITQESEISAIIEEREKLKKENDILKRTVMSFESKEELWKVRNDERNKALQDLEKKNKNLTEEVQMLKISLQRFERVSEMQKKLRDMK